MKSTMDDFLTANEKLNQAVKEIFESYRRGEDYLIQRKWLLSGFKQLFDIADHCGVHVNEDVKTMIRLRDEAAEKKLMGK